MSQTTTEIASAVLRKLGRLPDGQVAPPSQVKIIKDAYTGLYDELFNDGLVNWGSTDAIPDLAVYPITIMLTGRVSDDFGVPDRWSSANELMRFRISQQISSPYVPQPTGFKEF
jgi:hypothetical protein